MSKRQFAEGRKQFAAQLADLGRRRPDLQALAEKVRSVHGSVRVTVSSSSGAVGPPVESAVNLEACSAASVLLRACEHPVRDALVVVGQGDRIASK